VWDGGALVATGDRVWLYDGAWELLSSANPGCTAVDPVRGLLYGGGGSIIDLKARTVAMAPALGCPVAYDASRERWVVLGDTFATNVTEMDPAGGVARHQLHFAGAAARPDDAGFRSIHLEITLGATGQSDAGPLDGVQVALAPFDLNVTGDGGASSPSLLTWDVAADTAGPDGGVTNFARTGVVDVRADSLGLNGSGVAQLGVTRARCTFRVHH
jgi:hypothetical protein